MAVQKEMIALHAVTRQVSRPFSVLASAVCLAITVACGFQPPSQGNGGGQLAPKYSEKTGRLIEIRYDRNKDGKPDTWATMDGLRVVRIEIDEDGDGKVDRWEHYQPGKHPGVSGVLERVEVATRHDGHISRREFLQDGVLARIEEDTDNDGATDKWESYKDQALTLVELDTEHRGKPNRRLVYGRGGALERVEVDPDGSGRFRVVPQDR